MKRKTSSARTAPSILHALIAGFFSLMAFLPENGWWGVNHLFFYPLPIRLAFIALAGVTLLPDAGRYFLNICERTAQTPRIVRLALMLLLPPALFVTFRVTVHSLGDGYQRSFEIEQGKIYLPTEMLDYLTHALLNDLLNLVGQFKATVAMAATSIAAGVVFVLMLFRSTPLSGRKKYLFMLIVLTLGSSQLFFGYVESYTLAYLFSVWYLLYAVRISDEPIRFGRLTALYLLAAFSHQVGILLLPSYLLMAHWKFRKSRFRWGLLPLILLAGLIPIIVPQAINRLLNLPNIKPLIDHLLPFSGATYTIFSLHHFKDAANLLFLVIPAGIILAPLLWKGLARGRTGAMILSLAAPAILFIMLIDPVLTMSRDWDLFALPLVMAVLPILYFALAKDDDAGIELKRVAAAGILGMVMLASWVGINHDEARHIRRAEYILDHSVKGKRYGYELLAYHYSSRGDYADELRMLKKIPEDEYTARVYGKLSQSFYSQGNFEKAFGYAQKGLLLPNPTDLNFLMAGITFYDRKEFPIAIGYLRQAVDKAPGDINILCKLGDALRDGDSLATAIGVYSYASSMNPNYARPYFGLAYVFAKLGDRGKATEYFREGMSRDPKYPTAATIDNLIRSLP